MAYKETEETKVLQGSIDELRRTYDHITNIYDQLRLKALALIAGEVAIVAFIFTDYTNSKNFVPVGTDRQVIFFGAIAALGLAFGFLLWVISSVPWKLAHDTVKSGKLHKDYSTHKEFLEYLNDYYCDVLDYCNKLVSNKCKKFNWVVYLLAAGVILLLIVTKLGG